MRSTSRIAVAVGIAVCAGACSLALPVSEGSDEPVTTGSLKASTTSPLSADLGPEDWRRAKGALAIALDPQGSGASVSWDNPDSGQKGNFVPVGQPFVSEDVVCRAFLSNLTTQTGSTALQGTACRPSGDDWTIKDVKPWRKPT